MQQKGDFEMKCDEYIRQVTKEIRYLFDRAIIAKELQNHLCDSIEDLMEEGFSKEDAEFQAVLQMGNPVEVGKQLNREHHPVLGYLCLSAGIVCAVLGFIVLLNAAAIVKEKMDLSMPYVLENSTEIYPLDDKIETDGGIYQFDAICLMENGEVFLTCRMFENWFYSRTGFGMGGLSIRNQFDENVARRWLFQGSRIAIGICVEEGDDIVIETDDHQKIEFNLEEIGL